MKITLRTLAALLLLSVAFAACEKENEPNPVYNLRGNANGTQEVPANPSPATGTISGTYNKETNVLNYTITWTGLTTAVANMHFHGPADPGKNAGVAVGITGFSATTSGSKSDNVTLTDQQETDLMNGLWYYNIHTSTYTGGEIRGQIVLTQ